VCPTISGLGPGRVVASTGDTDTERARKK